MSNTGYIKNTKTNKTLVGDTNSLGYKRVILSSPSKKRMFVHRVVAFYFCDGYEKDLVVNHKDGNKKNNNADNLEWCTRSENDIHAFRNNLRGLNGCVLDQIEKSKRNVEM